MEKWRNVCVMYESTQSCLHRGKRNHGSTLLLGPLHCQPLPRAASSLGHPWGGGGADHADRQLEPTHYVGVRGV